MTSSCRNFFSGTANAAFPRILLTRNPTIAYFLSFFFFVLSLSAANKTGRMGRKRKLQNPISKEDHRGPCDVVWWCTHCCSAARRGNISTPNKYTSNINSSELVHVCIHTILFSHISLSFVSCSLPSNLIMPTGEALAVKQKKQTAKQQNTERSCLPCCKDDFCYKCFTGWEHDIWLSCNTEL